MAPTPDSRNPTPGSASAHSGAASHSPSGPPSQPPSAASTTRRAARTLARAVARRCPNCGGAGIFAGYLKQRASCPGCGLRLDRGEHDFFIGAYTINLIAAELLVFFGGIALIVWNWPGVPWTAVMWGLAALMVVAPIVLYPLSRQLWLACDLILRPAEKADFGGEAEAQAGSG